MQNKSREELEEELRLLNADYNLNIKKVLELKEENKKLKELILKMNLEKYDI